MTVVLRPCDVARSPYTAEAPAPSQGVLDEEVETHLEIFPPYDACLDGLEGFSHLIVIFHFHLVGEHERSPVVRARWCESEVGAFASCSPKRPSGLGVDVVRLLRREGNVLVVAGGDMLDGTPVLDIRPYIPKYHAFPEAETGWTGGGINR